jgi:hypothetical protein
MVLAIAGGQRTHQVAASLECNEATIWRTCRRYESRGLSGILADDRMTVPSRLESQCRASAG